MHPVAKPPMKPLPKPVKQELKQLGYQNGDREDLATFQQARGVGKVLGVDDPQTWKALKTVSRHDEKHPTVLVQGDKNKRIAVAESRLSELGYDVGAKDGVYDAQFAKALHQFKKDHPALHNTINAMGRPAQNLLAKDIANRNHVPEHIRVRPSIGHRRLDAATQQAVAGAGVAEGAKGRAVTNIKAHLAAAGFSAQDKSNAFDARTKSAVEAFQKHAGLSATGTVDAKTWAALKKSYVYGLNKPMTLNEHSWDVEKAQKTLRELGYKHVQANGTFDGATQAAVKSYEKKHHLTVDGAISAGELEGMKKAAASKHGGLAAYNIAHSLMGKAATWLQYHGPIARFMDNGVPQNVNCANFVSSCLQYAGLIKNSQHSDLVSGLADNLRSDRNWSHTSLANAKPGDVCIVNHGDHVVMFAGRDSNGTALFIGSNNREDLPGHPQFVSIYGGDTPVEMFHYHG
jgi:peptidoglycan hydrolase-like protein with peptidoglycan-binding domain